MIDGYRLEHIYQEAFADMVALGHVLELTEGAGAGDKVYGEALSMLALSEEACAWLARDGCVCAWHEMIQSGLAGKPGSGWDSAEWAGFRAYLERWGLAA